MIRSPRRFDILSLLTLACAAAAACIDPSSEDLHERAIATALTLQDHTEDTSFARLRSSDPLQTVMGSDVGDEVLDAWTNVLTGSGASPGSLGGGGIPAFGAIGSGGASGTPSIHGGVANGSLNATGLPDGPSSSLGKFAAELCEFTAELCDRVLSCMGGEDVCSSLVSQSDCRATFVDGLRERGASSAPLGVMSKLRCVRQRLGTTTCQEDVGKMLAVAAQSCR